MKKIVFFSALALLGGMVLASGIAVDAASTAPTCTLTVTPNRVPAATPTPVTLEWHSTNVRRVFFPLGGDITLNPGSTTLNGSSTFMSGPNSKLFYYVALSGQGLANETGSYAFCTASLSTSSPIAP